MQPQGPADISGHPLEATCEDALCSQGAADAEISESESNLGSDETGSSLDSDDEDMQNRATLIAQLDVTADSQPFSGELEDRASDSQSTKRISHIENVSF